MQLSANELDRRGRDTLAETLGDTPEMVIPTHLLRRGLCRAVVDGPPERPRAAIIQAHALPNEPTGFGGDPRRLWALLGCLDGWTYLNVALEAGPPLAALAEAATGRPSALYEELYYVLDGPVADWAQPAARRLTAADTSLMEEATASLGMDDWRYGSAAALIADGFAAGAVIDGQLVAVAFTAARSDLHADIGIVTREDWRNRGLSTATAGLVCADVQAAGQIPVWGTGWDNVASQRVAAKLGFREVSRRVYVSLT